LLYLLSGRGKFLFLHGEREGQEKRGTPQKAVTGGGTDLRIGANSRGVIICGARDNSRTKSTKIASTPNAVAHRVVCISNEFCCAKFW
jgi:hypothetical protein